MKFGKLEDAKIPLQAVLGEAEVSVKDIAGFTEGTIIKLNSIAGEPVDLVAAGEKIAKGEVVIIDDNFGIRVTSIMSREEE